MQSSIMNTTGHETTRTGYQATPDEKAAQELGVPISAVKHCGGKRTCPYGQSLIRTLAGVYSGTVTINSANRTLQGHYSEAANPVAAEIVGNAADQNGDGVINHEELERLKDFLKYKINEAP